MKITTVGLARVLGGTAVSAISFAAFGASSLAGAAQPERAASTTASTAPAANPITALESIGPAERDREDGEPSPKEPRGSS